MCETFQQYRSFQREGQSAFEACVHARDAGLDNDAQIDMLQTVFEMTLVDARQTVQRTENLAYQQSDRHRELVSDTGTSPFQFSLKMIFVPPVVISLWIACFQNGWGLGLIVLSYCMGAWIVMAAKSVHGRTLIGWSISVCMMALGNLIVMCSPWTFMLSRATTQEYDISEIIFGLMLAPVSYPAYLALYTIGLLSYEAWMSLITIAILWASSRICFRRQISGCGAVHLVLLAVPPIVYFTLAMLFPV